MAGEGGAGRRCPARRSWRNLGNRYRGRKMVVQPRRDGLLKSVPLFSLSFGRDPFPWDTPAGDKACGCIESESVTSSVTRE